MFASLGPVSDSPIAPLNQSVLRVPGGRRGPAWHRPTRPAPSLNPLEADWASAPSPPSRTRARCRSCQAARCCATVSESCTLCGPSPLLPESSAIRVLCYPSPLLSESSAIRVLCYPSPLFSEPSAIRVLCGHIPSRPCTPISESCRADSRLGHPSPLSLSVCVGMAVVETPITARSACPRAQ